MNENPMIGCVVVGTEHHNTLGVIRSLGMSNIYPSVYLKESDKAFVEKSRYIKECIYYSDYDSLLPTLLRDGKRLGRRRVLISCFDKASEILDSNKGSLSEYYMLPGMYGKYAICDVQNKVKMSQLAQSVGLESPKTFRIPDEIEKVPFPCISKPFNSNYGGKACIRLFQNKEELLDFMNNTDVQFFVQEFIDKSEEVQFIGCSLDGVIVIIPGMSKIIRSQQSTNTGYLAYTPVEAEYETTLKKSVEFIQSLGYRGLFSVEFIRDKNGKIYFLEANFRNDGNSYVVTKSGVNLPTLWYKYNCGNSYNNDMKKSKSVMFMPEFQDFHFTKNGKVSLVRWICEFMKAEAHSVWSIKDPAPFLECIKEIRSKRKR